MTATHSVTLPSQPFKEVGCLDALEPSVVRALEQRAEKLRFPRGSVFRRQGDVDPAIYVLTDGRVRLYRLSEEGREQTLWMLGVGQCFCFSTVHHCLPSPYSVECLSDVALLRISADQCRDVLAGDARFDAGVIRCLSERVGELARLTESLACEPVRRRLAGVLVDLAERHGRRAPDGTLIEDVTHEMLAGSTGAAREVVSRTLKRLESEGLLRTGRARLLIRDLERLRGEASSSEA